MRRFCLLVLLFCAEPSLGAQRMVSLLPSNTEILYAIGAGPLIGVSRFCDYPPETAVVEKIGDLLHPNLEKIAQLKPDIVFAGEWKSPPTAERIRKMGLRVFAVPEAASLRALLENILLVGEAAERKTQAQACAAEIRAVMGALKLPPEAQRPTVYVELDSPHWTTGGNSYISDLIAKAGGRNIFADEDKAYFSASWESIVAKKPDVILVLTRHSPDFAGLPLAEKIPAVSKRRILHPLDINIYLRPSPRVKLALRELYGLLNEKK